MIQYVKTARKNPKTGESAYYAQIAPTTPLDFDGVAKQVEKLCAMTNADVKAVLMSLETVILNAITNGQTVRLGSLGSFRPTITSTSAATADKVKASNIKRVRCRFTQGAAISKGLLLDQLSIGEYKASTTGDTTAGA